MMKKFLLAIMLLLMPLCGVQARDFSGIDQVNWNMTEEVLQRNYQATYVGNDYKYGLRWDMYYLPSTKQTRTPGMIDIKDCVYIYSNHILCYVAYNIPSSLENSNSILESTYKDLNHLYGQPRKVAKGDVWFSPQNSAIVLMKNPPNVAVVVTNKKMFLGMLAGLMGY